MNEEENKVEVTETEEVKVEETAVEETKVEVTETTEEKAKLDIVALVKQNKKWLMLAAVALVLICFIASCAANKDRYTRTEDMGDIYMKADTDLLVTMNGGEVSTDEDIYSVRYSGDYSLTTVMTEDNVLYVIKKGKLVEVDEEIDDYIISVYGDSIAYLKDVENGVGELFLYNVAKEKSVEIDSEAYEEYITVSPDGKTVAYVGNCEMEDDSWWGAYLVSGDVFVSKNGKKAEKLYKDAVPVAVSDNAKYVYYVEDIEEDGKFCMNDEKIISDSSSIGELLFNDDLSELLYYADGSTRYFNAAKKTDVKVKSSVLYGVLLPEDVIQTQLGSEASYVGIDTFNKTVLCLDFTYYYMFDKGEETEKISSNASYMMISEDGKSLLYPEGDELMYIKNVTKSIEEEVLGEDLDIYKLSASKDLKKIYFVDDDDELFFFKKNGKSVSISDDVTDIVYSDEFGGIYFIEDEELFYATKSEKSKKSVAEDVTDVYTNGDYVLYDMEESKDEEVTYIMTGKKKSELFLE